MKALKILLDKNKISRDVMLMVDEMYLQREYNIILGSMLVLIGVYIKVWLCL